MSDYLAKREKAIEEAVRGIARIRRCSRLAAWEAYRSSALELLHLSKDTQMEDTWRIDIEIADRRIQQESGFSDVGATRRWDT